MAAPVLIAVAVYVASASAHSVTLTEFHPTPGSSFGSTFQPDAIAPGPNGDMWFWDNGPRSSDSSPRRAK